MSKKKHNIKLKAVWRVREALIKIAMILIVVVVLLGIGYGIANYMNAPQPMKAIMLRVLVAGIIAVVGLFLVSGNLRESVTKIMAQKFFAILAVVANVIWVVLGIIDVLAGGGIVVGCHSVPYQCNAAPGEVCLMIVSEQECGLTMLGWVSIVTMAIGLIVSLVLWIMAKVQAKQRKKEYNLK